MGSGAGASLLGPLVLAGTRALGVAIAICPETESAPRASTAGSPLSTARASACGEMGAPRSTAAATAAFAAAVSETGSDAERDAEPGPPRVRTPGKSVSKSIPR